MAILLYIPFGQGFPHMNTKRKVAWPSMQDYRWTIRLVAIYHIIITVWYIKLWINRGNKFSCNYFSWVASTHETFLLLNISQTTVFTLYISHYFITHCMIWAIISIVDHWIKWITIRWLIFDDIIFHRLSKLALNRNFCA